MNLPVIVGFGGINAAGRSSGHHSYKRLLADVLPESLMHSTWQDLAQRMGLLESQQLTPDLILAVRQGTLIRAIKFAPEQQSRKKIKLRVDQKHDDLEFQIEASKLPNPRPKNWQVRFENKVAFVKITGNFDAFLEIPTHPQVQSAACLPEGFEPGVLYPERFHPRGLKMAIYAASDALNSMGLSWKLISQKVAPDQIAVYASSAFGQIDNHSFAGLLAAPLLGQRPASKMIPLSLAQMSADFINSYVLSSVGITGGCMGACASFLYNMRLGTQDIQAGRARVAVIACSEAPIQAEIIEGLRLMGALADKDKLQSLTPNAAIDYSKVSRPFAENVGFTLAESAQCVVLMDDALALELGAHIYGSVSGVFVNADGNKKSISAPGVGNYITVSKAAALAETILGKGGLKRTYVQAHGTSTPQNRVTESHILNEVAKSFGIKAWPVTAVKSYFGHSMSAAGGDQLSTALGVWQYGFIPGIHSIEAIADDVHHSHLNFLTQAHYAGIRGEDMQATLLNAKGFGGNNATALILSPEKTWSMLTNKHGTEAMNSYQRQHQSVVEAIQANDLAAVQGQEKIYYDFGTSVMGASDVQVHNHEVKLDAFEMPVSLKPEYDYAQYASPQHEAKKSVIKA
jgi:acetoacetyl-[acyl-carrier protein] synthase